MDITTFLSEIKVTFDESIDKNSVDTGSLSVFADNCGNVLCNDPDIQDISVSSKTVAYSLTVSMPKGWKMPKQVGIVFDNTPVLDRMPLATKLSRPVAVPKIYKYPIKKIEIFESDTGRHLHPKDMQYITISPIEADYSIMLSSSEQGFPLPLRNVLEIKQISMNIVEFDFWGTGTVGITGVGSIGCYGTRGSS